MITKQEIKTIILTFSLWAFAGFDLLLLQTVSVEIQKLYFPTEDPTVSILAIYGTLSLSLLARVFGGLFFGRIADKHGRKLVITLCLLILSITMSLSAYLPSVYDTDYNFNNILPPTALPILFILSRIIIGFFIGGIWPTAAIFAMEILFKNKCDEKTKSFEFNDRKEYNRLQEDFKDETKRATLKSTLMQIGLFTGALISVLLYLFSKDFFTSQIVHDLFFNIQPFYIPYNSIDFVAWRSMSLFGGIFGFIIYLCYLLFFKESKEWINVKGIWKNLTKTNEKYLEVLEEMEKWLMREKSRVEDGDLDPGILKLLESKKYLEVLEEITTIDCKRLDSTNLYLFDNNKKYLEVLEEIEKSILKEKSRVEDGDLDPGILKLLESKKYRNILFGFWLILSGLMYMYYSTVVMTPELLLRDDKFILPFNLLISANFFWILAFLSVALISHLILGFFLHGLWKYKENGEEIKFKTCFNKRRIRYLLNLLNYISKSQKMKDALKIIYIITILAYAFKIIIAYIFSKILKGIEKKEEQTNNEEKLELDFKEIFLHPDKPEHIDILSIIGIGFIILILGILGSFFFYYIPINQYILFFTAIAILMANAGWAIVPSMLASRFPTHYRATGSSLAYNGGLAISFASPFIIMEFYLRYQSEYVLFFAMILGALSMITGAARIIKTEIEERNNNTIRNI